MNATSRVIGGVVALSAALGFGRAARAESWCATPLIAHEWGVQLFDTQGAPRAPANVGLPAWFHKTGPVAAAKLVSRVADLPPDSGIRLLPLLHFYAPGGYHDPIPLGLGVGFVEGAASVWFPQVDVWRGADTANSAAAKTMRTALERARGQLGPGFPRLTLPDDPTRQLEWPQLTLTKDPKVRPSVTTEPWITQARQLPNALWVGQSSEADRFVFYDAGTRERAAVKITSRAAEHVIENPTNHPVHDVFVIVRSGARHELAFAPTIPPGGRVTVTTKPTTTAALRAALRARWVDDDKATPERDGKGGCATGRDPAIPVEKTSGHRLYAAEIDLLLATWGSVLEGAGNGTTVVYREDGDYLDRVMPLSLFTDMYHHIELRRLGIAVWQNVGRN